MPYLHLRRKWTPFELFGIRIFISSEKIWYIKIRKKRLRRIRRSKAISHVQEPDVTSA